MPDIIGSLMGLFGGGNGLLAGLAGIIAVIVAAFWKGRSSGKAVERANADRNRLESMTEAQRIDDAIAFAGLLALTACQSTSGTFCDLAKPIRMTPEQVETLTDDQVAQYLGHNRRGERECGWRP